MEEIEEILRRLEERLQQDEALVQTFFQRLGETIPPWLVPALLKVVATRAGYNHLDDVLRTACSVDPNGSSPIWI